MHWLGDQAPFIFAQWQIGPFSAAFEQFCFSDHVFAHRMTQRCSPRQNNSFWRFLDLFVCCCLAETELFFIFWAAAVFSWNGDIVILRCYARCSGAQRNAADIDLSKNNGGNVWSAATKCCNKKKTVREARNPAGLWWRAAAFEFLCCFLFLANQFKFSSCKIMWFIYTSAVYKTLALHYCRTLPQLVQIVWKAESVKKNKNNDSVFSFHIQWSNLTSCFLLFL